MWSNKVVILKHCVKRPQFKGIFAFCSNDSKEAGSRKVNPASVPDGMTSDEARGVFRVLDIGKPDHSYLLGGKQKTLREPTRIIERETRMKPDQDWQAVWPSIRTFHPSVVPLPIRQGYVKKNSEVKPGKKANLELMKIQNFLHLTPPVIKKQCEVLKQFCTKYPEGDVEAEFPLVEITSTYLNSSSSIRDNRSRIVTWTIPMKQFNFKPEEEEKFLRLVGERYDPVSETVTIVADSCPYRKQNREYLGYLLTAVYHESKVVEDWESLKTEKDMLKYTWSLREARSDDKEHLNSVQNLLNEGESPETLNLYKNAVRNIVQQASSVKS